MSCPPVLRQRMEAYLLEREGQMVPVSELALKFYGDDGKSEREAVQSMIQRIRGNNANMEVLSVSGYVVRRVD